MINNELKKSNLQQRQTSIIEILTNFQYVFQMHFIALVVLLLAATVRIIALILSMLVDSAVYGITRGIIDLFQVVLLVALVITTAFQIFYSKDYLVKGKHILRNIKSNSIDLGEQNTKPLQGIVSFVNNVFSFFSRFSNEEKKLSDHLNMCFLSTLFPGIILINLNTISLVLIRDQNEGLEFLYFISILFFIAMVFAWIPSIITTSRMKSNVLKWENLFPQLEIWGQNLEQLSSENLTDLKGVEENK